jgi:GGDEF domain-containing protein/DNA-binding NarL/FixJ family response regulator
LLLGRGSGIELVGEAADGAQAVHQALQERPQIMLCDERMLAEPDLAALFATGGKGIDFRIVLVVANASDVQRNSLMPVAAVVPLELPGDELVHRLHALLKPAHKPPPPMVGMKDRFMVVEDPTAPPAQTDRNTTLRFNTSPAEDVVRQLSVPTSVLTGRLDRSQVPRKDEGLQEHLSAVLSNGAQHRDRLTGLAGVDELSRTLRALPRANHPTAVLVVDLQAAPGSTLPADEKLAVLHSVTAVLRANVRQHDLLFHLEELSFATVMPGLEAPMARGSLQRLRTALDEFRQPNQRRPRQFVVSMGIGFWMPGMPPSHPLQQGWNTMRAERKALLGF